MTRKSEGEGQSVKGAEKGKGSIGRRIWEGKRYEIWEGEELSRRGLGLGAIEEGDGVKNCRSRRNPIPKSSASTSLADIHGRFQRICHCQRRKQRWKLWLVVVVVMAIVQSEDWKKSEEEKKEDRSRCRKMRCGRFQNKHSHP